MTFPSGAWFSLAGWRLKGLPHSEGLLPKAHNPAHEAVLYLLECLPCERHLEVICDPSEESTPGFTDSRKAWASFQAHNRMSQLSDVDGSFPNGRFHLLERTLHLWACALQLHLLYTMETSHKGALSENKGRGVRTLLEFTCRYIIFSRKEQNCGQ